MQLQIKRTWPSIMHKLFDHTAVVLIGGTWKSGKTDFALHIAESLLSIPYKYAGGFIVQEVASNINTKDMFPQVSDLINLRQWLYGSHKRKLYILDEASEHLPSRRAMSKKNVEFIRIVPEISKAHARMIVIGHKLSKIDSALLDSTWCRGWFVKLGLKKAELNSQLFSQPLFFKNIPKTTIKFDPYSGAPFTEQPEGNVLFKDEEKQLLWNWSNGTSIRELGLHRMQLNRLVRKYVKGTLESEFHLSHT